MNIVVTGCNGFIGYHTCRKLLDIGYIVVGIDIDHESPMAAYRNHILLPYPNFVYFRGDIRSIANLRINDIDAVIHLAGVAGVRSSIDNPGHYVTVNIYGSMHILDLCVKYNVPKVIIASSSSVYGNRDEVCIETDRTDHPLSPYAATKKSVEVLSYSYHNIYNMNITNLRFFTVYGPAGRVDMAIPKFIHHIAEGLPITIYGDGHQTRAFTYIDDIVDGIDRSLGIEGYNIINLGNPESNSIQQVVCEIKKHLLKTSVRPGELLPNDTIILYEDRNPVDVLNTTANISKASDILEWYPGWNIDRGIAHTIEWYLENRIWAKDIY